MDILTWIILGGIAGLVASFLFNTGSDGLVYDIILGIVGAVVGGWIFNFFGKQGATGINLYSVVVSVIGALVVVWLRRQFTHR